MSAKPGFLSQLVPVVIRCLGDAFPEVVAEQERIVRILDEEEALFQRTLAKGIKEFNKATLDPGCKVHFVPFFPRNFNVFSCFLAGISIFTAFFGEKFDFLPFFLAKILVPYLSFAKISVLVVMGKLTFL
jgi:hypothetical protein